MTERNERNLFAGGSTESKGQTRGEVWYADHRGKRERSSGRPGLGLLSQPQTSVEQAVVPELGAFTRNDPVTWRQVLGRQLRRVVLFVGDLYIISVAQVVAHWLSGDINGIEAGWMSGAHLATTVVAPSTIILLALYRGYRDLHRSQLEVVRDVLTAGLWAIPVSMAALYLLVPDRGVSRGTVIMAGLAVAILLCLWRVPFVRWAKDTYREQEVTLVSADPHTWKGRLPGYITVRHVLTPRAFVEAPPATHGVLMASDTPIEYRERIVAWAVRNQVDLYIVPTTYEIILASGRLTHVSDIPLVSVHRLALPIEVRAVKRVLDLTGAVLLSLVFLPVILIVPLLIWLDDRGPAFYRQPRVGDGRIFDLFKFRTMVPDAERFTGPVWAHEDDPRVTRVGKWLRATRLDELPQVLNVLRGEMSLVGPRPERPELVMDFAARNPTFRAREAVKPGITGLAQVLGRYDSDPDVKLQFDLLYITRWGLGLDILILLWTIPVIIFPRILGKAVHRVGRRLLTKTPPYL